MAGRRRLSDVSTDTASHSDETDLNLEAPIDGFRVVPDIVAEATEVTQRLERSSAQPVAKNAAESDKRRPRVVYLPRPDGSHAPASVELLRPSDKIDIPDDFDSDNETGGRNRIGNVPLWWYDKHKHVGYDISGSKVTRRFGHSNIADLLESANPDAWRTIIDAKNQTSYRLTDEDLELIQRIRSRSYPNADFNVEDGYVEFDNPDAAIYSHIPTLRPKAAFLPSRTEEKQINDLIRRIRQGRIPLVKPSNRKADELPPDVWGGSITVDASLGPADHASQRRLLVAPKDSLPGHAASYNPPAECLYDEAQKAEFMKWAPEDDKNGFIPQKFSCLRHIPLYERNLHERFQRMLDLYLCPRSVRLKDNIDPESLLPILPNPEDLRPFPSRLMRSYGNAEDGAVSAMSVDRTGTYVAVGRSSGYLQIFDIATTVPLFSWTPPKDEGYEGDSVGVSAVQFNPLYRSMIAVSTQRSTFVLLIPLLDSEDGDESVQTVKRDLLHVLDKDGKMSTDLPLPQQTQTAKTLWFPVPADESKSISGGWEIREKCSVTGLAWHPKGRYLVTVCNRASNPSFQCGIHSLTKVRTLRPFRKSAGGKVQAAAFHPLKPELFVQYYQSLRVYSLQAVGGTAGRLQRRFKGMDHATGVAVHPSGEHCVTVGGDRKARWYDEALGGVAYKTFDMHTASIKAVGFHPSYPLLFTAAADGTVQVTFAKVYFDLFTNPSIIPVKTLNPRRDFTRASSADACLAAVWHPIQPVLLVGMRSGCVGLYA